MLTEIVHDVDVHDQIIYIYKIYIAAGYQGLTAYSLTYENI